MADPASPSNPANLLPIVARAPAGFMLIGLEFGVAAVFALAVIPAIASILEPASPGWIRWVASIAYIGFAVTAVSSFHSAATLPDAASAYVSGDAATRAAIAAQYTPIGATQLDGWGLFQFGGVGLWALVVGTVALRHRLLTRDSGYLAVALGLAYLTQTIGEIGRAQVLIGVAGFAGTLVAIAWFLRLGIVLRRTPLVVPSVGVEARAEPTA